MTQRLELNVRLFEVVRLYRRLQPQQGLAGARLLSEARPERLHAFERGRVVISNQHLGLAQQGRKLDGGRDATSDVTPPGCSWPSCEACDRRRRSAGTFHTASATMPGVILLVPVVRSQNVIGTSRTRPPIRRVR